MRYYQDITHIVNSKEFRRLQDKTQLYYTHKDDHYRTRLTHTIEVCDIALRIAQKLKQDHDKLHSKRKPVSKKKLVLHKQLVLNKKRFLRRRLVFDESLIIAIAYGHDIGHTPFGHIGERVISNILSGSDNLGGLIKNVTPQYFKHNIHSYRILSHDLKDTLDWKILDGVLKHTNVYQKEKDYPLGNEDIKNDPYLLNVFLCGKLSQIKRLKQFHAKNGSICYHKHNVPLTLEGQIVALADEIAQRSSDYDDAIKAGVEINIEMKVKKVLEKEFNLDSKDPNESNTKNRDKYLFKKIKEFLISEVEIKLDAKKIIEFDGEKIYLDKCIVLKGDENDLQTGRGINKYFEDLNKKYVIESEELRRCDSSSKYILRQLFKAYYNDIAQIRDAEIKKIFKEIIQASKPSMVELNTVEDEKYMRITLQTLLKLASNKDFNYSNTLDDTMESKNISSFFKELLDNQRDRLSDKRDIIELSSIIIRLIGFYIAKMTDSFAREEYKRLYGVKMPINSY